MFTCHFQLNGQLFKKKTFPNILNKKHKQRMFVLTQEKYQAPWWQRVFLAVQLNIWDIWRDEEKRCLLKAPQNIQITKINWMLQCGLKIKPLTIFIPHQIIVFFFIDLFFLLSSLREKSKRREIFKEWFHFNHPCFDYLSCTTAYWGRTKEIFI